MSLQYLFNVSDEPMKSAAADSLSTVDQINDPLIFQKPSTATYPAGSFFGAQLQNIQKLIQASADTSIPVNLETVMIDYGGWDNHANMGPTVNTPADPSNEEMHNRMKDLFESMNAFYTDLQTHEPNASYTFVVLTEFGRRITANGDAGVDHGKGSLMVVMGSSGINGQNVFTMLPNPSGGDGVTPGWNGLQAHSVVQSGTGPGTSFPASYNMLNTIDYRRVLGEILEKRLMLSPMDASDAFPGFGYGSGPEKNPIGALL